MSIESLAVPALTLGAEMNLAYFLAPIGAVLALLMAFAFSRSVMARSEGTDEMISIAQAVRDGAMAYLKRQYLVVFFVFIALLLFLVVMSSLGLQTWWSLAGVPVAGLFSGLCGWFGMKMATNASARTTHAAKQSLNEGLTVAFRSGAVMGLVVVGFALLDASVWFFLFNTVLGDQLTLPEITTIMLSFGMGASTQALFARVGGGIYTKAADVGADLVGKVEAGIPEDDARNPATIADNVGDNVGDVAGMGADLYESYYGSILATMALGAAAAYALPNLTSEGSASLAVLLASAPLALAGLGIFCSIIGVFTVRAKEGASFAQLLKGLHKGVYVASGLIFVGVAGLLFFLFGNSDEVTQAGVFNWWGLLLSVASGLVAGNVIAYATEYYTSYEYQPTKRIAQQALTGPATVIISGVAEGMKSTWASLATVVVAILLAYVFAGGGDSFLMGLYGVGIAAVGMLSTLGITLATDAYGPIADNAGGNAEMTSQEPFVRERTDMLDSLGNTTAATGKGFAIGSAALTALALFAAFIQVVQTQIRDQSLAFYANNEEAIVAPDQLDDDAPFAVYEGYGKFVVIFPGRGDEGEDFVDGAILADSEQPGFDQTFLDLFNPRDTFAVEVSDLEVTSAGAKLPPDETRLFTIKHLLPEEDSPSGEARRYEFDIVGTANGRIRDVLAFYDVTLTNPRVLGGVFIGVLLVFLFCALTMNAVGRAAYAMMGECRRQFAKIRDALRAQGMSEEDVVDPDNWPKGGVDYEGQRYPDYATCVAISTAGAQKEMVFPSVLAILVPIAVGLVLSVPGVMGMLAGGLTSGFAVAIFMANAGGAWDNAKKLLESYGRISAHDMVNQPGTADKVPAEVRDAIRARAEEMIKSGNGDDYVYGKGSDDHKATVVGDTVGDPFKDTSGPSLNILIKLISIVSVVFAGLTVAYGPALGAALGLG
jgi:H(+)-translocating pyrophosphatase